jgi:hypothetical protein
MLLPLLSGFVVLRFRASARKTIVLAIAGLVLLGVAAIHWPKLQAPWMGNTVTEYGAVPQQVLPAGESVLVLSPVVRVLLMLATVTGFLAWPLKRPKALPVVVLGLIFAAAWLPVVLFRSVGNAANDRYVIPFVAIGAIALLGSWPSEQIGRLCWTVLLVFAFYAVATTHDAFAAARGRLTAAESLVAGVAVRTEISAGIEYDGWTQLLTAGYANHALITKPPGAYAPIHTCTGRADLRPWYLPSLTAIRARYVVTLSPMPGSAQAVTYTTWLPPGRRTVFVSRLDEPISCR